MWNKFLNKLSLSANRPRHERRRGATERDWEEARRALNWRIEQKWQSMHKNLLVFVFTFFLSLRMAASLFDSRGWLKGDKSLTTKAKRAKQLQCQCTAERDFSFYYSSATRVPPHKHIAIKSLRAQERRKPSKRERERESHFKVHFNTFNCIGMSSSLFCHLARADWLLCVLALLLIIFLSLSQACAATLTLHFSIIFKVNVTLNNWPFVVTIYRIYTIDHWSMSTTPLCVARRKVLIEFHI